VRICACWARFLLSFFISGGIFHAGSHIDLSISCATPGCHLQEAAQGLIEACKQGGDPVRSQLSPHIEHYLDRAAKIQATLRQTAQQQPPPPLQAATAATDDVNSEHLQMLMDMGLEWDHAHAALRKFPTNVEEAVNWALTNPAPASPPPSPTPPPPAPLPAHVPALPPRRPPSASASNPFAPQRSDPFEAARSDPFAGIDAPAPRSIPRAGDAPLHATPAVAAAPAVAAPVVAAPMQVPAAAHAPTPLSPAGALAAVLAAAQV